MHIPAMTRWILLALLVVAIDAWSKSLASSELLLGRVTVLPFLDLLLSHNTGAAFSFLHQASGWQRIFFSVIAILVSIVILWMLASRRYRSTTEALGLALLLGGAWGNLLDRVRLGYVVDFIYLHYQQFDWPVFNVADMAITGGALLMVWSAWQGRDDKSTAAQIRKKP